MTHPYGWPNAAVDGPPVWHDAGFAQMIRLNPALTAMREHLERPGPWVFAGQREIEAIESSYRARGYGLLLYALARVLKPVVAVEIGIFQGFSLLNVAAALRDNGTGHITGYDLFEAYPYRHADRAQVQRNIAAAGLQPWASIAAADAFDVDEQWDAVDYLHVDVSNSGDTYRRMFGQWSAKVRQVMVFEGGARERDNVAWMLEYGKTPIAPAVRDLTRDNPDWSFTVLEPFPSMTIAVNRAGLARLPHA